MLKKIVFTIAAAVVAVIVTAPVQATPFKDIALPEMIDEAVAGLDLPADR